MSNTANLVLPFLAVGQAQKHVTVNETLRKLDAIVQLSVVSATTAAEPASPSEGAVYIVPPGKTGAHWSAYANHALAYYRDGAWVEIAPREGWLAFVKDAGRMLAYRGAAWSSFAAGLADANVFTATQTFASAHAASLAPQVIEEELTLSGPNAISTIAIPNGSICFGVSERVTEAITGASSFKVGISGELNKFGDLLGLLRRHARRGHRQRLGLHRRQGPPRHPRPARNSTAELKPEGSAARKGAALPSIASIALTFEKHPAPVHARRRRVDGQFFGLAMDDQHMKSVRIGHGKDRAVPAGGLPRGAAGECPPHAGDLRRCR